MNFLRKIESMWLKLVNPDLYLWKENIRTRLLEADFLVIKSRHECDLETQRGLLLKSHNILREIEIKIFGR